MIREGRGFGKREEHSASSQSVDTKRGTAFGSPRGHGPTVGRFSPQEKIDGSIPSDPLFIFFLPQCAIVSNFRRSVC